MDGSGCVTHRDADSAGIWLPGGVGAGRSIPQVQGDLLGHLGPASWARDRAVIGKGHLCCDATEARAPNAPAACFLLIAASILAARKLAQYDGGKKVSPSSRYENTEGCSTFCLVLSW